MSIIGGACPDGKRADREQTAPIAIALFADTAEVLASLA